MTTFVSASGLTIVFEQHAGSKVAVSSLGQPSKASELLKVRRGSTVLRIYADEASPVSEARRALGVIDDRPASRSIHRNAVKFTRGGRVANLIDVGIEVRERHLRVDCLNHLLGEALMSIDSFDELKFK